MENDRTTGAATAMATHTPALAILLIGRRAAGRGGAASAGPAGRSAVSAASSA